MPPRKKQKSGLLDALQSKHCFITTLVLFILWMHFSNGIRNDNLTKCFILIQSDPPTTNGARRGAAQGPGPWLGISTITLKF